MSQVALTGPLRYEGFERRLGWSLEKDQLKNPWKIHRKRLCRLRSARRDLVDQETFHQPTMANKCQKQEKGRSRFGALEGIQ